MGEVAVPIESFMPHQVEAMRGAVRGGCVVFNVRDIAAAPVVGIVETEAFAFPAPLRRVDNLFYRPVNFPDLDDSDDGSRAIAYMVDNSHHVDVILREMPDAFAAADGAIWHLCREPAWCITIMPADYRRPRMVWVTLESRPHETYDVAPSRSCRLYFRLDEMERVAKVARGLNIEFPGRRALRADVVRADLLEFDGVRRTFSASVPAARTLVHRCLPFLGHDAVMLWTEFRKLGPERVSDLAPIASDLVGHLRRATAKRREDRRWLDRAATWMEALALYSGEEASPLPDDIL